MAINSISRKIINNFSFIYFLIIFLIAFLIWANFFLINKSVRAQGVVISAMNNQIVQVVDGGVLSEILVEEGGTVGKGQVLAKLEDQRVMANYQKNIIENIYLRASLNRINALILDKPIVFNDDFTDYPDIVNSQVSLFRQDKKSFEQRILLLKQKLEILEKILERKRKLFNTGDLPELDILETEREIINVNESIINFSNDYYYRLKKEKEKLEEGLAKNQEILKEQQDIIKHTKVYSPVSGVIKQINIKTLGAVLRSGDAIMEISPSDGDIVVEAQITSKDIADVNIGDEVIIKLDAFDFTIFGSLKGNLTYISSDVIVDDSGAIKDTKFYKVIMVINDRNELITPKLGMSASVEIVVGRRTILEYLIKPIKRAFDGALEQR